MVKNLRFVESYTKAKLKEFLSILKQGSLVSYLIQKKLLGRKIYNL